MIAPDSRAPSYIHKQKTDNAVVLSVVPERGPESLGAMLRLLAGHDPSHLDQIIRYVQAVQQPE